MNKTVRVNLGGFVFQLDEDAYALLKAYLTKLEQRFETAAGGSEIIEDIEGRIAELLTVYLVEGKEVISQLEVEKILNTMGDPEAYADGEGEAEMPRPKVKGKLHREPNNMVIGGVASGIGLHLGINPAWVRLLLLLSVFVYTIGFWVYLILWVVLPVRKMALPFAEQRNDSPFVEVLNNIFSLLGKVFKVLLRVITIVLGLVLVLFGFPFLIALFGVSLFPIFDWGHWGIISPREVFDFINFAVIQDGTIFVFVLLAIVSIIPVLMATYLGVRLLFQIRVKDAWLHVTSFLVWLGAAILLGIITAVHVTMFVEHDSSQQRVELSVAPDTLRVMMDTPIDLDYFDKSICIPDEDIAFYYNEIEKESCGLVTLNVRQSNDSLAYFRIEKDAGGASNGNAYHNLSRVKYNYVYNDKHLALDEGYKTSDVGMPWIPAGVEVELYVPKHTVLVVDERIKRLRRAERSFGRLSNKVIYVDMN